MKKVFLFILATITVSGNLFAQLSHYITLPARQNIVKTAKYSDTIARTHATKINGVDMINDYVTITRKGKIYDAAIKYFTVDAATLLYYIYLCESLYEHADPSVTRQIQHLSFEFGRTTSGATNLFIVAQDENLENIYIPTSNVLTGCLPCSTTSTSKGCLASTTLNLNAVTHAPYASADGITIGGKLFPPARVIPGMANYSVFVSKYNYELATKSYSNSLTAGNEQSLSFIFDPAVLAEYIYNTDGIQDIQVILARKNLTHHVFSVIIVGLDKDGNQIYLTDAEGSPAVLEHCYPCPSECAEIEELEARLKELHKRKLKSPEYKKVLRVREMNESLNNQR